VTDTRVPTQTNTFITHLDEVEAFLRKDADTHMPLGSAANRALQIDAIGKTRDFLTGGFAPVQGSYQNLRDRFAILSRLAEIQQTMVMDAELFMPADEAPHRQDQMTTLGTVSNLLIADPQVEKWLDESEKTKAALAVGDGRNLQLMRRQWVHDASLTSEMAGELSRLTCEGENLHTEFRKDGDWSKIKDWYAYAFDLMRSVGEIKKSRLGTASVYEALMDTFSPGLKEETVVAEFAKIEKVLPGMISEAMARQALEPKTLDLPKTAKAQQEELCRRLAKAMCFDFDKGRMDMSDGHPWCATVSDDSRFTVDYIEDNFLEAVMTTAHEGWHGRYAQNLPAEWRHQPVGGDLGGSMHESMSQIGELYAGRSPAFFRFLEKEAQEVFNLPDDKPLSAENLQRFLTRVKPSLIRIYADEVTYPAHIILHSKLERAIIEGTLDIKDYETAFNDGMRDLLGIVPSTPRQGCGQDVHIPCGMIGYKPDYLISRMVLTQLAAAACRDRPDMEVEFADGDFTKAVHILDDWLRENVQSKGSLLTFDDLLVRATGEKLNSQYYLEDLSKRYLGKPNSPSHETAASDGSKLQ
jgi:carboxypeptidase Taq